MAANKAGKSQKLLCLACLLSAAGGENLIAQRHVKEVQQTIFKVHKKRTDIFLVAQVANEDSNLVETGFDLIFSSFEKHETP